MTARLSLSSYHKFPPIPLQRSMMYYNDYPHVGTWQIIFFKLYYIRRGCSYDVYNFDLASDDGVQRDLHITTYSTFHGTQHECAYSESADCCTLIIPITD